MRSRVRAIYKTWVVALAGTGSVAKELRSRWSY